jgi:hypothetical protein
MRTDYILLVYEPGQSSEGSDAFTEIEMMSPTPFTSIHVGDKISVEDTRGGASIPTRIVKNVRHQLMIYMGHHVHYTHIDTKEL